LNINWPEGGFCCAIVVKNRSVKDCGAGVSPTEVVGKPHNFVDTVLAKDSRGPRRAVFVADLTPNAIGCLRMAIRSRFLILDRIPPDSTWSISTTYGAQETAVWEILVASGKDSIFAAKHRLTQEDLIGRRGQVMQKRGQVAFAPLEHKKRRPSAIFHSFAQFWCVYKAIIAFGNVCLCTIDYGRL
jgi:hypothetical protein